MPSYTVPTAAQMKVAAPCWGVYIMLFRSGFAFHPANTSGARLSFR